ncbi:MAG: peptidoglycan editing factor PgeF [Burkholderiaceae bacterium]|nr:MAG: peptidoglycan editing factor PgeF [Burkholderiaceae bacterium]
MSPSIIAIKDFFPENVTAFYTTRTGGFSKHPYSHFNLANNVGDNPDAVKHNRKLLLNYIKCKVVWLKQVHSNKIFDIDSFVEHEFSNTLQDPPIADSSITSKMFRCCAVMTADCLPILVSSQEGTLIGSIHCGWKGLLNKVINVFFENFFDKLYQIKKPSENLVYIWLGPCISQKCYPVGPELEKQFVSYKRKYKFAFKVFEKQICMDIRHVAEYQIKEVLELNKVNGEFNSHDMCTYKNEDLFFSHRRQNRTGRQASLIFKNKT